MHHAASLFTFVTLVGALVSQTLRDSSFLGLFLCHQRQQGPFSDTKADWQGTAHVHVNLFLCITTVQQECLLTQDRLFFGLNQSTTRLGAVSRTAWMIVTTWIIVGTQFSGWYLFLMVLFSSLFQIVSRSPKWPQFFTQQWPLLCYFWHLFFIVICLFQIKRNHCY